IEFRFAELQNDRLPALVADLVRRQVAVIGGVNSTEGVLVAKGCHHHDPDRLQHRRRPGQEWPRCQPQSAWWKRDRGELPVERTGAEDVEPSAPPASQCRPGCGIGKPDQSECRIRCQGPAGRGPGHGHDDRRDRRVLCDPCTTQSVRISDRERSFNSRRQQFSVLAAYHKIPAIYGARDYTDAGGLMSYAPSIEDAFRRSGVLTGRILKGEKPADLPVVQPVKFEFAINLKTAKALGIEFPPSFHLRADVVME